MTMDYYRGMLTQTTRIEAFRNRIAAVVQPDDTVLEIGTGLGTYAFFAAAAGAKKVWAVEGAPVVNVSKTIARVNDFHDRVEFVRGWYPGVSIPERADVLIFENYPPRLIDSWTFDVLRQLHREALKPGARVVPDRARLCVAPVRAAKLWEIVGRFGADGDVAYGIDWSPSREYVYNTPLGMPISQDDLQHEARAIADVRLDRLPSAEELAGETSWTFRRSATIHGLAYWFDMELQSGVWLSNAPGAEPGAWGYLYLPVAEPVSVPAGGNLAARVAPEVGGDGAPKWLTWEIGCGTVRYRGHEFKSFPASLSDLLPSSPSWTPELHAHAKTELHILSMADGKRSVEQIARAVQGMDGAADMDEAVALVLTTLAGRTEPTSTFTST